MNSTGRQYNYRHTYATMCPMAGMNPTFIAPRLGRSVQMLLTTYARWINSNTAGVSLINWKTILIALIISNIIS
ncbi:integrase [Pseudomonas mediterranea]|uniref:Integrase n=1 Tax=Pseudomonas mediterranea TaxID=183795 RepID=A0AAX2DAT4_9PSED|nr:integrase [Pseudomonas mediterranea]